MTWREAYPLVHRSLAHEYGSLPIEQVEQLLQGAFGEHVDFDQVDTRRGVSPGSALGCSGGWLFSSVDGLGSTGQDDGGARRSLRRASSSSPTRVSIGWPGTPIIVTTKRLGMSARLLPSW